MTTPVTKRHRDRRQKPSNTSALLASAAVKVACGTILTVVLLLGWSTLIDLNEKQATLSSWDGTDKYAVFYPLMVGEDQAELETGGHESAIATARDLVPRLEEMGALFIDAAGYEPGAFPYPHLPAAPIRVNLNYLAEYPLVDEHGDPINIATDETAWIVAVPMQFKPHEQQIREVIQTSRTGGTEIDGAIQGQRAMLGEPVPDELLEQSVQIIWTQMGQEVFSFNSTVNPESGNIILDPIIEIMTPSNSLTVDRLNAITGELNTALKVYIEDNSSQTLHFLTPLLTELGLSDNLQYLITPNESMIEQITRIESIIRWTIVAAIATILIMLVFTASFVSILCDRFRRRIIVRRLHGLNTWHAYAEVIRSVAVTTALVGIFSVVVFLIQPGPLFAANVEWSNLGTVLASLLFIDVIFVLVITRYLDAKNMSRRLKEL